MTESTRMKVAVSGASGLIGTALVPALRERGHEVLRLVRREARAPDEVSWSPADGTIDVARLQGVDAAICLSGVNVGKRWTAKRKRAIVDSRIDSTSLLARTVAELEPRPSVFLCAGGIDIYGDRGDEILTEESELGRAGFMADLGKAWEAAADPARAAGVRVVTFRQAMILSREGGALARMLPFFRLGVGGRVGDGRSWWSWVSREDVVAAYVFALEGDLEGPVNLVSPNPVQSIHFVKALGRALGRPTVFPLPAFGIGVLFGEMGETVLLDSHRVLPARLLEAGFAFSQPELDGALRRALDE